MGRNRGGSRQAMNVLFTMLLFLVFVMCALFTVLIGGKVYENISSRMNENFTGTTALSYLANKVRQGDMDGKVRVREVEGVPVLELAQEVGEETFVTWIYYQDGGIRELFTDTESGLGLADGLEIIACEGLSLTQEGRLITIETKGSGGGKLTLALRSGGWSDE